MKMRELEAKTGINRETIRVWIRHGLLPEPERPARNVADYTEDHVRAIQAVRKLQRDSGMTLPQIKTVMNGGRMSRHLVASAFPHLEELVASRVGVRRGLISLETLVSSNPKAAVDAEALDRIGLITLIPSAKGPKLSITDAGLVDIWGQMRKVGFTEERGFPPEILDFYVDAAEAVAGNEARIFLTEVEGRMEEQDAAAMLEFALPAMLNFFGILRQRAFLRNIAASVSRKKAGIRKADRACTRRKTADDQVA